MIKKQMNGLLDNRSKSDLAKVVLYLGSNKDPAFDWYCIMVLP